MGTVLLPNNQVRSRRRDTVSVPFTMGTVLLLVGALEPLGRGYRFSPLLDGDGVASILEVARTV